MKKITFFIALISFAAFCRAQKPIELYDLVSLLIQNAGVSASPGWNTPAAVNETVKWKKEGPPAQQRIMTRDGVASILINGKPVTCVDEISDKKKPCRWELSLLGGKTGYNSFSLHIENFPLNEPTKAIDAFFPKNKSPFTFIKHCIEGFTYWSDMYQVTIPGKQPVWMMVNYENASATMSQYSNSGVSHYFTITFLMDKKAADSRCQ